METIAIELCRLCLKSEEHLLSLFDTNYNFNLLETIEIVSGIKIVKDDGLPECICGQCCDDLIMADNLRQRCIDSDAYLRNNSAELDTNFSAIIEDANDLIEEEEIIEEVLEPEYEIVSCSISEPGDIQNVEEQDDTLSTVVSEQKENSNDVHEITASYVDNLIIEDSLAQVSEGQEANLTQCCGCIQHFNSYEELQNHSQQYHLAEKAICGPLFDNLIECTVCYKIFSGVSHLDSMHRLNAFKHRIVSIGFPEVIQCCSCEDKFPTREELHKHAQSHIQEKIKYDPTKPYECEFCFKRYGKKQTLTFHQKFSFSYKKKLFTKRRGCQAIKKRTDIECATESRKCCGCPEVFPSADSLKQHSQMHHELYKRDPCPEKPFECETCFKQFSSLTRLEQHRLVPYIRDRECGECHKTFLSKQHLRRHMVAHHNYDQVETTKPDDRNSSVDQSLQCEECGKIVKNKYLLKSHKKSNHSSVKPFSCSLCNNKFKWKHLLQSHLRTHTKEQPYKCKYCPKRYTHLMDKTRHETSHTKIYPLQCGTCGKGFMAGRKKHLEKHEALHEAGEEYPLTCQFCDRTFTRLVQRNRHQARHVAERNRNLQKDLYSDIE